MAIQQNDIRQIVHRLFTIACHSGGDPFTDEYFSQGIAEVREILKKAGATLSRERRARVEIENRSDAFAQMKKVRDYLPHNFDCKLHMPHGSPAYIEIMGYDVDGWTLDRYVIPRLASGLIFAKETN